MTDAGKEPSRTPKISLGSWAFSFGPFATNPWPFDQVCRYAADAGYDGVEINGFRPHPHYADYESSAALGPLSSLLNDLGLGVSGYAPDFTGVPPAEAPRANYLEAIDRARAFCERMNIRILRVDSVTPPNAFPRRDHEERFRNLVETWGAAADRCERSGITLVWEFEPGFWLNRPIDVERVAREVPNNNFKILFDTSHAYTGAVIGARHGEDPNLLERGEVEYAELLQSRVGHLHVIDCDGSLHDNETSAHLPFGQGNVDFAGVIQALKPTIANLDWWCVDFCFCPTTEQDARVALPFVRSLAAGVAA